MNNVLEHQVGGNHYKKYKYQPIEFAFKMGYDPAQFSMLKYLTRYPDKGGMLDLEKIDHYAEIEELLGTKRIMVLSQMQEIEKFVSVNELPESFKLILIAITISNKECVLDEVKKLKEAL